jgi:hypothetical protein
VMIAIQGDGVPHKAPFSPVLFCHSGR